MILDPNPDWLKQEQHDFQAWEKRYREKCREQRESFIGCDGVVPGEEYGRGPATTVWPLVIAVSVAVVVVAGLWLGGK